MLNLQLVTFLIIFASVRPEHPNDTGHSAIFWSKDQETAFGSCVKNEVGTGELIDNPATKEEGKCHLHCMIVAYGLVADGKVNVKKIPEVYDKMRGENPKEIIPQLEAKCSSIKATGKCELGNKLIECFHEVIGENEQ